MGRREETDSQTQNPKTPKKKKLTPQRKKVSQSSPFVIIFVVTNQFIKLGLRSMITFCPSVNFVEIAKTLDDKRLGGQRTEAWSILKWLRNPVRYKNFVAAGYCAMWKGYEPALVAYTNEMLNEWERRGKKNELLKPYQDDGERNLVEEDVYELPPWWGCEELHSYHRHALVAKLPEHYGKLGWKEDGSLYNGSYPWPREVDGVWVLRWPKALKIQDVPVFRGDKDAIDVSNGKRKIRDSDEHTESRSRKSKRNVIINIS